MRIRSYLRFAVNASKKLIQATRRRQKLILISLAGGAGAIVVWMLFLPQTVPYSFDHSPACQVSPRLFPSLSRLGTGQKFQITRPATLSVGSFVIYSNTVCTAAVTAPKEQTTYTYKERLFNWPLLGHSLRVATKRYPALAHTITERRMVPIDATLNLALNKPDHTFRYTAVANGRPANCAAKQARLTCKLDSLELAYSSKYDIKIVRQFKQESAGSIASVPIATLTPIDIKASSISAGAEVQNKPGDLIIETNKKLAKIGTVLLVEKMADGSERQIPSTTKLEGTQVKIAFSPDLPRKAAFEVRVASLTAADGSGLASKSMVLPFKTSGGPKVVKTNIGGRNVGQNQSIVLEFDQELLPAQDPAPLVSFAVLGKPQSVTSRISGNKLTITPAGALPLCATFTINVTANVQNQFGVTGDSAWNTNSRVICYTTFSIGASVRGRAITAYKFGSGSNPIIYMGAMHGSEANSRNIMTEWFNELRANPQRLGARSLVVIPAVNPDGIASGSRYNANGIDINRNFPAADWKSVVTSPDNPNPTPAGGPSPLSEPESRAVAAYIRQTSPRLILSFHSAAALVEANEAADSVSIAATYAAKSRYQAIPKSQSAGVFKYDTTGAMEDWMRSSLGQPAIVVELLTRTSSEFSRNRDALWYTAGL